METISKTKLQNMIEQHQLWLKSHSTEGKRFKLYLSNVDLSFESLKDANLPRSYLANCDLSYSDLSNTNFFDADMSNATLIGCNLQNANLSHASLYGTDLRNANLVGCKLNNTNLNDTDLRGAKFDINILKCYMLTDSIWLKTDIPWYLQHPGYAMWGYTIELLDDLCL